MNPRGMTSALWARQLATGRLVYPLRRMWGIEPHKRRKYHPISADAETLARDAVRGDEPPRATPVQVLIPDAGETQARDAVRGDEPPRATPVSPPSSGTVPTVNRDDILPKDRQEGKGDEDGRGRKRKDKII